ncbi:MAG: response regulator [Alphaproteobacteria bacterium]|nr:response regulator [Alphaproteobacteria bacterium]MBU1514616.1 response regulator [Alphaproteobacteria bacterium]MBU2096752.1 response regulator [Alphaproteobacteria bacterium]MBU2150384.1 response regulator [Alphaproteobacteria bacterium]MBU2306615.1 response regulator [Alphaproteobacteria bacterium]
MQPKLKRILIADPQPASARMFSELMRDIAHSHVWIASNTERAEKIAETCDPQIIVIELGDERVDGLGFTRKIRRSTWACRKAPIITITGSATAGMILAARDSGVHEFLRKPYSMKDLLKRLEAVTLRERDWVEGVGYIGPDRRRFNSGDYAGALKRKTDGSETPFQQKINQALKIIRAAVAAADTDPQQAMRAMLAQATTLQSIATDFRMTLAASEFYRHLTKAVSSGVILTREDAERWATPLLAFLPKDVDADRNDEAAAA